MVLNYSNDFNLYHLCSDRLKKDHEFVKYLIYKFKDNIDFICDVADYYLSSVEDQILEMEIILIMCELTVNDFDKTISYKSMRDSMYSSMLIYIYYDELQKSNGSFSKEFGVGFSKVFDEFRFNDVVLKFYAKKLIYEILSNFNIDLENLLHMQFISPEQIDEFGIDKFILRLIKNYDFLLSAYLDVHIDLIGDLISEVKFIQKNWEAYIFNYIIDSVHEFLSHDVSADTEVGVLYYIARKLGISEKVKKYDGISDELYFSIMDDLNGLGDLDHIFSNINGFDLLMKKVMSILHVTNDEFLDCKRFEKK